MNSMALSSSFFKKATQAFKKPRRQKSKYTETLTKTASGFGKLGMPLIFFLRPAQMS